MFGDNQPILILEDDLDDQELLRDAFHLINVENELLFFVEGNQALDYLLHTTQQPFIIFTDMNLPGMNGLEFQQKIQENEYLRKKSIPFIFFTTTDNLKVIQKAFDQHVQGFFQKPSNFEVLTQTLKMIIDYWRFCLHPNIQK